MKIFEVGDIKIFDVNNPVKFDVLADELMRVLQINADHQVMNGMPIGEYAKIIRYQLETKYEKFKLLVGIDWYTNKIVSYTANFIVNDEGQHPIVLIYGAYFKPGTLVKLLPPKLAYTDIWSDLFGCKQTKFATTRYAKAYERLMRQAKIGFKISPLVTFERTNNTI